jgi:hypothetical protein
LQFSLQAASPETFGYTIIILRRVVRRVVREWIGFIWLRIVISAGLLMKTVMNLRVLD